MLYLINKSIGLILLGWFNLVNDNALLAFSSLSSHNKFENISSPSFLIKHNSNAHFID